MNRIFTVILLSLTIVSLSAIRPAAADAPLQFALVNPIQLVDEIDDVKGFRLNVFYGVNNNVSGFDFGFINYIKREQRGLQLGFFNTAEYAHGIQFGLFNRAQYLNGIQIGLFNRNEGGKYKILPLFNYSF